MTGPTMEPLFALSESLYEHLRVLAHSHPRWLKVSPRRIAFDDQRFRARAVACFHRQFQAGEVAMHQVLEILAFFLVPRYFASVEHLRFAEAVVAMLEPTIVAPESAIAALVVDAGQFRLDEVSIGFLESTCGLPFGLRLACADWRAVAIEIEQSFRQLGFSLRQCLTPECFIQEVASLADRPAIMELVVCAAKTQELPTMTERITRYRVTEVEGTLVVRNECSGTYRFFTRPEPQTDPVEANHRSSS